MEVLNKLPNMIKPRDYLSMVQAKLQNVEVIPAPKEITMGGQVIAWLEEYVTTGPQAKFKEELLMNKSWTENGKTYFSGMHFKQWLTTQRIVIKDNELWNIFRKAGGSSKFVNLKGKGKNVWVIKAFVMQQEHFDIPQLEDFAADSTVGSDTEPM